MPEPPPYRYGPEELMPGVAWRHVDDGYHEASGVIRPRQETVRLLPVLPYTGFQRVLHRLGICRWHRHRSLARLFERLRSAVSDGRWDVVR